MWSLGRIQSFVVFGWVGLWSTLYLAFAISEGCEPGEKIVGCLIGYTIVYVFVIALLTFPVYLPIAVYNRFNNRKQVNRKKNLPEVDWVDSPVRLTSTKSDHQR